MRTLEPRESFSAELNIPLASTNTFHDVVTIEVEPKKLLDALETLKNPAIFGYDMLMDLTAVDYLTPTPHTKVVYCLHNSVNFSRVRLCTHAARGESVPSVCHLWSGAAWYEREVFDLFGVIFHGHRDLKRILMPDTWSGHPLRRDYALTEEPVQFKHGVKPKIPSQIIPHVKSYQRS